MARARKQPAKRRTAKPKAKAKPRPARPKAKQAKPKRAAKPKIKPAAKPKSKPRREAVPIAIFEPSSARRRALTARERLGRSSPVVEILDDAHPIGALRRFLDSIKGEASAQQAQIALDSAQLMLLPIRS